jgi:hypothetical protein
MISTTFLPELKQIHELNERWNKHEKRGIVTFKITQCYGYDCKARISNNYYKKSFPHAHSIIMGYYTDEENKKRKKFLGYNILMSNNRMNHVLSFINQK